MPDPNITLTAIQSHTTALGGAIRRHEANAARCKVWSVGVVAGVMVFAAGRTQMAVLPWVAGVLVLLAVADACQGVMVRICTDAYNGFMRKLPLNGGNAMKAQESFVLPATEPGWRQAGQVLGALGSLSVLPFYGALLALVIAFHVQSAAGQGGLENRAGRDSLSQTARRAAPEALATSAMPVQSTVKTSQPVIVGPRPTPRTGQSSANGSPAPNQKSPLAPTTLQPGQPPTLSPLRPVQQQPGVRLAPTPPNRLPVNGGPGSGLPPQGSVPAPVPAAGGLPALQPAPPILGAEPPAPAKGFPPVPAVPAEK
jgi:hypothetical protein